MAEAFLHGCASIFSPAVLLFLFIGTIVGMFVGILPGLGAVTTIAVLLPFVWKAPPEMGLSLLLALLPACIMGGAITAILINIPGEDISVVTLLDGYPMNKKGEGSRAIVVAVISSILGGLISVAMAFMLIPIVAPLVLAFGFPELFFVMVLGLSFIAALAGRSKIKGLISGGLGIFLSLIGFHPVSAVPRFTFGSEFLYDGLNVAVVMMGLFGVSEMISLIMGEATTIAKVEASALKLKDIMAGVKDVITHWLLLLRSTVIGYIIGAVPAGSMVAVWVTYGQAKQSSKNPEKYGKGHVDGVIAPQSGGNAAVGAGLLTTLVFGIPCGAVMSVLVGGFFMVGIVPGIDLVRGHLDLVFALLMGLAIANIMAGVITLAITRPLARIAYINIDYLFPIITVIIFVAAFITQGAILDFVVVIAAGLLGLCMKRFGYSLGALCLGFVLGKLLEKYLLGSLALTGSLFFVKPIPLIIILIIAVIYSYRPLISVLRKGRSEHAN